MSSQATYSSAETGSVPVALVDSCVLLDIATRDATWAEWSEKALARARDDGPVVINPVVYAEVSVGFDSLEELNEALPARDFVREPLPYAGASSQEKRSWRIGSEAEPRRRRSPTSISVHMRQCSPTG